MLALLASQSLVSRVGVARRHGQLPGSRMKCGTATCRRASQGAHLLTGGPLGPCLGAAGAVAGQLLLSRNGLART